MSHCSRFLVEGRVQGVWFRESTRQQAKRLQISGHAINLTDGRVEAVFSGPDAVVDQIVAWCHHGPPSARVDLVTTSTWNAAPSPGFALLPDARSMADDRVWGPP